MATSGTYSFSMSRDKLVASALRLLAVYDPDEPLPTSSLVYATEAMNILCKSFSNKACGLWCLQTLAIPLVTSQSSYNLTTVSGQAAPIKVIDCILRTSTGLDTFMSPIARSDYHQLGGKTVDGSPIQYYYDKQLAAGMLTVYPAPSIGDTGSSLILTIQRQIQDINLGTDSPDFPAEALRMLKWGLAEELMHEYDSVKVDKRVEITRNAERFLQEFIDVQQENNSVYFTPSERRA